MQNTADDGLIQRAMGWLGIAGVLAVLLWLAKSDSGYFYNDFTAAAIASVAILGVLLVARWDRVELIKRARLPLVFLALMTCWTGISIIWSLAPNFTLQELSRMILYLAVFMLVLIGDRSRSRTIVAAGVFVTICLGLALFALLAKISASYSLDYTYFSGRLLGSLGYWNALAIMMSLGAIPCLWFASSSEMPPWVRLSAAISLLPVTVTLFFTLSRGGIFITAVAILLFLIVATERLAVIYSLVSALLPGGLLVWYTYNYLPSLHAAEEGAIIDAGEGRTFAVLLLFSLLAAAVIRGLALLLPSRLPRTRTANTFAALFWLLLAAIGVLFFFSQLDRLDALRNQGETQVWQYDQSAIDAKGVERLASTSDNRIEFWRIGWTNFRQNPVLGTGANTYRYANAELQSGKAFAKDPHSIWIRFLSDQGLIGFILLLCFLATLGLAYFRQMKGNHALLRDGLYLSLLVACVAWLADSTLEFNWALPAVTVSFFFLAGLALRLGAAAATPVGNQDLDDLAADGAGVFLKLPEWLILTLVLTSMTFTVILTMQLVANIYTEQAWAALDRDDLQQAVSDASLAHKLNFVAVDPLLIISDVKRRQGDPYAARDFLVSAIDQAPREPWLHHQLALLEFYDLLDTRSGLDQVEAAIVWDPQNYDQHILLHRMIRDGEIFDTTGNMPKRPEDAD